MELEKLLKSLDKEPKDAETIYSILSNLLKEESQDMHYQVRSIIGRRWIKANEDSSPEKDKYSYFLAAINKLIMDKNSGRYFEKC